MDIEAMIAAQQEWIDKIDETIGSGKGSDNGAIIPVEVLKGNIEAARSRIDQLNAQRDDLARRLDGAIADEKAALARMEQTIADMTTRDQAN